MQAREDMSLNIVRNSKIDNMVWLLYIRHHPLLGCVKLSR